MTDLLDRFFETHPEWRECADLVVMPPTAHEASEEWPDLEGSSLLRHPDEDSSFGVSRLALYLWSRRQGNSHRFAEMIATQTAPRCLTDDVFFAGLKPWMAEVTPQRREKMLAIARQHGFTPSPDAIYHPGLARFPGDPEAYFTRSQGRGHIQRLCEARGWGAEGAVNLTARAPEKDHAAQENAIPLAENIIADRARDMIQENPGLKSLGRQKLRERVLERYGPST